MNSKLSPLDEAGAPGVVTLPESCSTVAAEELRVQLVMALDAPEGGVSVDASAVDSVGQAVLQLLVAAKREADAAGKAFTITNPTPAFSERVTSCLLADAIGLDAGEGALA